jgi:hypothetical protein
MMLLYLSFVVVAAAVGFNLWVKLRDMKRAEYIRTFTLPKGLYEKLQKTHPQLTIRDCELVGRGLRQFFLSYLKGRRKFVAMPSQVVDDLWHEFILYTRNYEAFCQKSFGRFLHHAPAAVLSSVKQSNEGLRRCWYYSCREELINPKQPSRLPLLFALDTKFAILGGFLYSPDCSGVPSNRHSSEGVVNCGGDFGSASFDGGTDGFGDASTSSSSDGGGDSASSGCGGGCGGD